MTQAETTEYIDSLELKQLVPECDLTDALRTEFQKLVDKTACKPTQELLAQVIESLRTETAVRYMQHMVPE